MWEGFMMRYKKLVFANKNLFVLFSLICGLQASSQAPVTYVFVNAVPGRNLSVGKPSSFTNKYFVDIENKIQAPTNAKIKLGVSVIFDYLAFPMDSVERSLTRLLSMSKQTKMPVMLHLDGINWMKARPDLWNWWDAGMPGYNPANKKNVEWTGWDESSAIKISWRNWGMQFRTLPAPNLSSPAIIGAQMAALEKLIPIIKKWYDALPIEEKYLLGGVKLGHEASIGVNAYYYKNGNRYLEKLPKDNSLDPQESYNAAAGFSGGLASIGYAAVKTAGIKSRGRITAIDLEQVVYQYLDTLSKKTYQLGLPKNIIYTHQGGTFAPWQQHLSFAPAVNNYSSPGWSFYSTHPKDAGDLGDVLDSRSADGWAAVEWWWPGNNKLEWLYNLHSTLTYKGCRFLAIFNWENGLEKSTDGIEAVRTLFKEWK